MSRETVAIIGGGFSGLATAYLLSKEGVPVRVYEAGERCGGLINTTYTEQGMVENAARGIMNTPRVEQLLEELGVEILELKKKTSRDKFSIQSLYTLQILCQVFLSPLFRHP